MLPSEKAELWMRRLLYALLIAIVLYLVVWMTRFIWGVSHRVLQQRQPFDGLRVAPAATAGRTPSGADSCFVAVAGVREASGSPASCRAKQRHFARAGS